VTRLLAFVLVLSVIAAFCALFLLESHQEAAHIIASVAAGVALACAITALLVPVADRVDLVRDSRILNEKHERIYDWLLEAVGLTSEDVR